MLVAICDDEQKFVDKLKQSLRREFLKNNTKCDFVTVNSGKELLSICNKEQIDVVFLDIVMPEFDGLSVAHKIRETNKDIMIVFVSSNEANVYSSYEYEPIWFVPKSQMSLVERAVNKILSKTDKREKVSFIPLELGNKMVEIDINRVKYFKNDGHYVKYFKEDEYISESFRCKLKDIEVQLSSMWFVKSHSRYLVNLGVVSSIEDGDLILINGEHIPISRSHICIVKERFQDYLRSVR